MSSEVVIAAIVTGVFSIISGVVIVTLTFALNRFEDRNRKVISSNRSRLITGRWQGDIDFKLDELSSVPVFANIKTTRKNIKGEFQIQYPKRITVDAYIADFSFEGGFLYQRFLQLNYIANNKQRIQFGAIVLELAPDGETMSGKFIGYGAFSQKILSGTLQLQHLK